MMQMMKSKTKKSSHTIYVRLLCLIITLAMGVLTFCSCSSNVTSNQSSFANNQNLVVHYLDVGQGDSIFVELPNSQTMLIDAGIKNEGEGIKNYISSLGYSSIDYLVATHPHADHIGSMAYVVENMNIGSIYMPKVSTTTKTYEKLLTAISDKNLKIKSAHSGMSILNKDNLNVDILGPVTIDEDELNNCSVIIKIKYQNNKFLFIGDAEKDELSSVASDVSADVLKVGHHGSRTSTTKDFLERVNPKIAVISVGKDNDYGHPHKKTINLLNEFDIETYRTDKDGTVTITSDETSIDTQTNGPSIEREN